ncbi:MAG: efflux transporter periplasmic adaptor subunit [Flammeovirgaceae bacterium]|nr:efflux transporter periplasmic adaptor subunit [Flammeovirgaceae bacterium]MBR08856.1 efflux transporter periplasmic adaptor subunit [Rickettsiales bacterium]HCX24688.1 efflux transporter periplasmic adaptor subunit [Cytophagales bacterium]|tara:strand:- start:3208 stop:4320 length:1113 start_codon:yes stop_codon:yes gene_type:complete
MRNFIKLMTGIALSFWLIACSEPVKKESIKSFEVIHPIQSDTSYTTEYVGEIYSIANVQIRSRITGYLEKVHTDEGRRVKKGDLLFSLSSHIYEQDLRSATASMKTTEAELKTAKLEMKNIGSLKQKGIVSQTEYELAAAKVEGLQAQLEEAETRRDLAQLNLSFTDIRAPFDGIINRIPYRPGSLVEEGTPLTSIANDNEVFVYFNVSERDYLDYVTSGSMEQKQAVSLRLANGAQYAKDGYIETVEGEIDKSTGNIAFRARFSNDDQILKHGGTGKILWENTLEHVVMVPQKSTFEIQGNTYVYVVDDNNQIHAQPFELAHRIAHSYVVKSGVQPSDWILSEGVQHVRDGDIISRANSKDSKTIASVK